VSEPQRISQNGLCKNMQAKTWWCRRDRNGAICDEITKNSAQGLSYVGKSVKDYELDLAGFL